jgi:hypothetical protein
MTIDAKYGNYGPENMAVTLEAIRTRHIALRAESREYHLRKYMWRVTYMERIARLFVSFC